MVSVLFFFCLMHLLGTEPQFLGRPKCSIVTTVTELSRPLIILDEYKLRIPTLRSLFLFLIKSCLFRVNSLPNPSF